MSNAIEGLSADVRAATVNEVKAALKSNVDALDRANSIYINQTKQQIESMDEFLKRYQLKQSHFFAFEGIRSGIFWAGAVCNILVAGLLVYAIFFR